MRNLIILTLALFSTNAFSRKPASVEYNCHYEWQTLTEALVAKDKVFRDEAVVKMTKNLEVSMNLEEEGTPQFKVTEYFNETDKKNYLQYTFSCDKFLSCKGERVSQYEGKSEKTKVKAEPSSRYGSGSIEGRDLFVYQPKGKSDFDFFYTLYKDENEKPMGLKISCHE